jgi:hypothetical protein
MPVEATTFSMLMVSFGSVMRDLNVVFKVYKGWYSLLTSVLRVFMGLSDPNAGDSLMRGVKSGLARDR